VPLPIVILSTPTQRSSSMCDDDDPRIDPVDEMLLVVFCAVCFTIWAAVMIFVWR
jgi:hypothetical protein